MHRFNPDSMSRLTGSKRLDWFDPSPVIKTLSNSPGMIVLDFGAGPGFFSIPIAQQIDKTGLVIATDIEPKMLTVLMEAAVQQKLANIQTMLSNEQALALRSNTVDRVLMSLVLHEIENRHELFAESFRVLTCGGKLVLVEWRFQQTEHGPDLRQRLDPRQLAIELRQSGLVPNRETLVGDNCYVLTATKPEP